MGGPLRRAAAILTAIAISGPALGQTRRPSRRPPAPPQVPLKKEAPDLTCPAPLGVGVKTKLSFCEVNTGRDPAAGIIIRFPPHRGPVTLTFTLHNRHLYSMGSRILHYGMPTPRMVSGRRSAQSQVSKGKPCASISTLRGSQAMLSRIVPCLSPFRPITSSLSPYAVTHRRTTWNSSSSMQAARTCGGSTTVILQSHVNGSGSRSRNDRSGLPGGPHTIAILNAVRRSNSCSKPEMAVVVAQCVSTS